MLKWASEIGKSPLPSRRFNSVCHKVIPVYGRLLADSQAGILDQLAKLLIVVGRAFTNFVKRLDAGDQPEPDDPVVDLRLLKDTVDRLLSCCLMSSGAEPWMETVCQLRGAQPSIPASAVVGRSRQFRPALVTQHCDAFQRSGGNMFGALRPEDNLGFVRESSLQGSRRAV